MILLTAVVSPARLPDVTRELGKLGLAPTMVASAEAAGLTRRTLMHRRLRYATNAAVRVELLVSPAQARRAAYVIVEAHDADAGEQVRLWTSEVGDPLRPSLRQSQEPAASTP